MRITMSRDALRDALAEPAKVAARSTLPATSCVLVDAGESDASFMATDQIESAQCRQLAMVSEPGRALIPAKGLASIVKTLPDEAVTITADAKGASIGCGKAEFTLPALDPGEFPWFDSPTLPASVSVPFPIFAEAAKACAPMAAYRDAQLDAIRGVLVECDGEYLTMTATDSYRAIRSVHEVGDAPTAEFSALFPAPFLAAAASIRNAEAAVLSASDSQIRVDAGDVTISTRALEGRFPNMTPFFGGPCLASATVDRAALVAAVKRAMAVGSASKPIDVAFGGGVLGLSVPDDDGRSMREDIDADTYESCTARLDPRYLHDAAAALDAEDALIEVESPLKPVLVKGGAYTCMIMPCRR